MLRTSLLPPNGVLLTFTFFMHALLHAKLILSGCSAKGPATVNLYAKPPVTSSTLALTHPIASDVIPYSVK